MPEVAAFADQVWDRLRNPFVKHLLSNIAKYHADNPWICAHKTIAKGTVLTVTNVNTGAQITCEVGDRGPYVDGRILDLSKYAFSRLANPSSCGQAAWTN